MSPAAEGGWESIPAMTAAAADRFGEQLAIADGDTRLSYRALFDDARHFGAALVASGVEPGDRVAIWAYNSSEWVVAMLGLFQAGAVLVPVNTRFKGVEAVDILARSRAKVLVTVTDFLGTDYVAMLQDTGVDLPELETIVVARGPVTAQARSWEDFLAGATDDTLAEVERGLGSGAGKPEGTVAAGCDTVRRTGSGTGAGPEP